LTAPNPPASFHDRMTIDQPLRRTKLSCLCQLTITSLINVVALVNSCRFGWKAIVLLEYCGNSSLLFSTV